MRAKIPETHSLRKLFTSLVGRAFEDIGLMVDTGPIGGNISTPREVYLSNLLVDFCDSEHIRKIKNAKGVGVTTVRDLLYEMESSIQSVSFEREDEVHKHIGDFTLFFAGLFPQYLKHLKTGNMIHHPDHIIDHVKAGKSSYSIYARHCSILEKPESALYAELSNEFEINVLCLNQVERHLKKMAAPSYVAAKELIIN